MKYGSLVNQIYAESKQTAPYVGQGVTELMYSDSQGKDYAAISSMSHISCSKNGG